MRNQPQRNGVGRKRRPPESEFFDTLKGQLVRIERARDGSELTATLLWVDRFTLGLRDQDGYEFCMNKGAIETMGKRTTAGKRNHERGATSR